MPSVAGNKIPGTAGVSLSVHPAFSREVWTELCSLSWSIQQGWIILEAFRFKSRATCVDFGDNTAPKPRGLQSSVDSSAAAENSNQRVYCPPNPKRGSHVWELNHQPRQHIVCILYVAI